ncbi:MAG: hypothetical protein GF355_01190 [Candidatus Eisenbacteria bacterium]|nr:hypothetical protein [Candidatus Eisenbacteria bacterium]
MTQGRLRPILACVTLLTLGAAGAGCGDDPQRPPAQGEPRTYYMALSPFPGEPTPESFDDALDYVRRNADFILHQHTEGVPWAELGPDGSGRLPALLQDEIQRRVEFSRQAGLGVYVATTPLNRLRDGLAPEWGTDAPPPGWEDATFDLPQVRDAYVEWCFRLASLYEPDVFAVMVEPNVYEDKRGQANWIPLASLYQEIYFNVTQIFPDMPVFVTFQLEYLHGELTHDGASQWDLLGDFNAPLDFTAFSTYPSLAHLSADDLDAAYFLDAAQQARAYAGGPVILAETGYPSEAVTAQGEPFFATMGDQETYVAKLLDAADRLSAALVVWRYPFDFGAVLEQSAYPPAVKVYLEHFVPMGLKEGDGVPKLADDVWYDNWLRPVAALRRR